MTEILLIAACVAIVIAVDPLLARLAIYLEAQRSRRK
jgi:hypothetical protein